LAGIDITCPVEKISILDVACGSGWVTAGLMQKKNLNNCKFHAFDISPEGPNMLARFVSNLKTSNCLEMSVQDAEAMKFSDDTFDVIIGSSVLHHFDNYESFLNDCRRILRPGGSAIFGEPFALGYGMAAAVLLIAQKKLKTNYKEIETNYNDIAFRNVSPRALLNGLVDKHLFYTQTINSLAQDLGFSSVSFNSPNTGEYIRNSLINELLRERGINDNLLAECANNIWGTFFDIFNNDNLEYSLCPFMNIVFRK
jgi:ubiquinone/menaquinone biosynthesis C-methylase UbiE